MWVEKWVWLSYSRRTQVILLVRMWVEKSGSSCLILDASHPPCEDVSWKANCSSVSSRELVILLVRMWVEKSLRTRGHVKNWSSSLWGCELKSLYHPLVAMMVHCHPPCEDVSWKIHIHKSILIHDCHPPCEDVSWKGEDANVTLYAVWSSSLWGCELKSS